MVRPDGRSVHMLSAVDHGDEHVRSAAPAPVDPRPGREEPERAGARGDRTHRRPRPLLGHRRLRAALPRLRPVPTRPARPANRIPVPGTVAYWRFDAPAHRIADLSGHGNELTKVTVPGTLPRLPHLGPRAPPRPAGPRAPVLRRGHEPAARHLSADSRQRAAERRHLPFGPSSAAGKTGGDPDEPLATLSLSGDRELQRAVYPLNQNGPVTNRGHELPLGAWWHVAVVNDGRRTAMYVKGCPVVRTPSTRPPASPPSARPDCWAATSTAGRPTRSCTAGSATSGSPTARCPSAAS